MTFVVRVEAGEGTSVMAVRGATALECAFGALVIRATLPYQLPPDR
jgi:hypothetical protein